MTRFTPENGAPFPPDDDAPKLIAFYLPQYHPIPENDDWWGKGFTEWTNVTKAKPLFSGHHQPRMPADMGYYDLRLPEVREAQAELARQHGIHGFCYYYYFFEGGKKLLDRPLSEVLASGKPDFPFCLCWANENWTRRWDGQERDVLMLQNHGPENNLAFIRSVVPYFQDPRYIRVDGRPLLMIYRATLIPDMPGTIRLWREELARHGLPAPYLIAAESFDATGQWAVECGFDASCEFPPHKTARTACLDASVVAPGFKGSLYDYEKVAASFAARPRTPYPLHRCVTLAWDNTARKGAEAFAMVNFSLRAYHGWLSAMCEETRQTFEGDRRILFVNAWNEWAEGTYLEPDRVYGHGYLEATDAAMRGFAPPSEHASTDAEPHRSPAGTASEHGASGSALAEAVMEPDQSLANRYRLIAVAMIGNEADIVEAFVRENLRFVDQMLIADHNSQDGTREILAQLSREGLPISVRRIEALAYSQQTVTNELMHEAIHHFAADWVVPLDADEFLDARDRRAFESALAEVGDAHARVAWMNHVPTVLDDGSEPNPLRRMKHFYAYGPKSPEINPWIWKTIVNVRLIKPYLDRYGLVKGNHFVVFKDTHEPSAQPAPPLVQVRLRHYPARCFAQLALKTGLGTLNQRRSTGSNALGGFHWQQTRERIMQGDQDISLLQFSTRRYLDMERIDDALLVDTPIMSDPYPVAEQVRYAHLAKPALSVLLNWIERTSAENKDTGSETQ